MAVWDLWEKQSEQLLDAEGKYAPIMKALADPRWDWRTAKGVAKELGKELDMVQSLIDELSETGFIVQATNPQTGEVVYATRIHYQNRRSAIDKIKSALSGTVNY